MVSFVSYGLGSIGSLIASVAVTRYGYEMLGAIDVSSDVVGKDVGEVLGLSKLMGIKVESDAEKVLKHAKPDVVFHATGSYLDKVYDQISLSVTHGADVISTCETLAYPYYRYPGLTAKLDEEAKRYGVSVVGLGINPGFLMDLLPSLLTAPCINVRKIEVTRSLDASKRRKSFQKKIGLGLSQEEFERRLLSGDITCHVGFSESILLMASIMGIKLQDVTEMTEPLLAKEDVHVGGLQIKGSQVRGIVGQGIGYLDGMEFIKLKLIAAVGEEDYDEVKVYGEPNLTWRCTTGTPGDIATVAMVLNSVRRVMEARPGLLTVKDILPITCPNVSMKL
ncbi:MAG: dihydrodipicolinate reductase [Candidatus Terraquivivens tikiterensis]|uniref:Dihydrodipicolinate reductase n=1 Tax=Candidatus Terraquivivens tikiterensis TaxID=1980982 RepID=A0A2R7Y5W7_9ARCH|nr:MAG: dihydrodipicolinate reductase [Candidatus Terraquivivens tikiterensis]